MLSDLERTEKMRKGFGYEAAKRPPEFCESIDLGSWVIGYDTNSLKGDFGRLSV